MNFRDPETMSAVIGNVLRFGVVVSGMVILFGVARLAYTSGSADTGAFLVYHQSSPHDGLPGTLPALVSGLASLNAYAIIELGVILLLATPALRVAISVFLFAAERDRLYVLVTAVVLTLLLFSMFATPFIPGFHA